MIQEEHKTVDAYDRIIAEAQVFAASIRHEYPALPSEEELAAVVGKLYVSDSDLIAAVRRHLDTWPKQSPTHNLKHLATVAVYGAYAANLECKEWGIVGELKDQIVQRAWRAGWLHDSEWWRGRTHPVDGSIAAQHFLGDAGIEDEYIPSLIRLHWVKDVEPTGNPAFDIPLYSLFAADHMLWGLEREGPLWEEWRENNIDLVDAIHEYQYLVDMSKSPNLQRTTWGRDVAVPYLQYGIEIARHIEETFS